MNADRTALLLHRRLTQATQVWLDTDRDASTLLGAGRLVMMREWAAAEEHAAS